MARKRKKAAKGGTRRRRRATKKNPARTAAPRKRRRTSRRRRSTGSAMIVVANPSGGKRRRRSRAKHRKNPSKRRVTHRRRKNPGFLGAVAQLGIGALGAAVGIVGNKLFDRATLTPKERAGAKVGTGLFVGMAAALLSPAAGIGLAGAMIADGGGELYDATVAAPATPAAGTSPPALSAVSPASRNLLLAQQLGVVNARDLAAVESMAGMGAVSRGIS